MTAAFLARRVALGVVTLFVVSVVVFAAVLLLPGDAAQAILGQEATPDRLAALRAELHLGDPVVTRYASWVGGLFSGDLGTSAATQQPVGELISDRVLNSLFLVVVSALVAIPLSIALGVWMAARRDRLVDHVGSTVTLALAALPEFVIGIALVLVFATTVFRWLPAVSVLDTDQHAWDSPSAVILPGLTLVLAVTPHISRIMRGSMVEVLESEYVTMARLKGLSRLRVIWRHGVPNAIVPAVQVSALQLAWMAGGVVVVEYVFGYPGIGTTLIDAVGNRDLSVVQTLTILAATVYVALNLVADVVTVLLTPRLRTEAR